MYRPVLRSCALRLGSNSCCEVCELREYPTLTPLRSRALFPARHQVSSVSGSEAALHRARRACALSSFADKAQMDLQMENVKRSLPLKFLIAHDLALEATSSGTRKLIEALTRLQHDALRRGMARWIDALQVIRQQELDWAARVVQVCCPRLKPLSTQPH